MKRKEARKRKIEGQNGERLLETGVKLYSEGTSADELPKKTSKQALPPSPPSENILITENNNAVGKVAVVDESTYQGKDESLTRRPQRFIVFIGPSTPFQHCLAEASDAAMLTLGNLPYTATDESISQHFAKINPKSIRHRKEKDTGKSKGFAFLEFEGYDRMKTCLKIYHQSNFEDQQSPARKLNVELT